MGESVLKIKKEQSVMVGFISYGAYISKYGLAQDLIARVGSSSSMGKKRLLLTILGEELEDLQ